MSPDDFGDQVGEIDAEENEGDQGGEELDDADGPQEVRIERVVGDRFGDHIGHGVSVARVEAWRRGGVDGGREVWFVEKDNQMIGECKV